MKKLFVLMVMALMLLMTTSLQGVIAQGQKSTPDADTKAFYAWYIKLQSNLVYPLLDKSIYNYVGKETVDKLREAYRHNRLPGDGDYFTKVQDYNEDDWAAHIETQPTIMLGDVAVVPVTFGSSDKVSVLVFLRKQDGTWKITKVDDTRDYL